jgi:hypothetical protein
VTTDEVIAALVERIGAPTARGFINVPGTWARWERDGRLRVYAGPSAVCLGCTRKDTRVILRAASERDFFISECISPEHAAALVRVGSTRADIATVIDGAVRAMEAP